MRNTLLASIGLLLALAFLAPGASARYYGDYDYYYGSAYYGNSYYGSYYSYPYYQSYPSYPPYSSGYYGYGSYYQVQCTTCGYGYYNTGYPSYNYNYNYGYGPAYGYYNNYDYGYNRNYGSDYGNSLPPIRSGSEPVQLGSSYPYQRT